MTIFLWILVALTLILAAGYFFVAIKFRGKKKILNKRTHFIAGAAAVFIITCSLLGIKAIRDTISGANTDTYLALLALEETRDDVAVPHLYEALGKGGYTFQNTCASALLCILNGDMAQATQYLDVVEFEKKQSKQNQQVIAEIRALVENYSSDPQGHRSAFKSAATQTRKTLSITAKDSQRCEEYYDIERDVFAEVYPVEGIEASGDNVSEKIGSYQASYPHDENILRLKVGYNYFLGNPDYAQKLATELVEQEDSLENRALYTDLIAQDLYANHGNTAQIDREDDEAYGYYVKSRQYGQKAEETEAKLAAETSEKKREKLNKTLVQQREKEQEYYNKAVYVPGYRAVNYLEIKMGWFGDNTGLCDLARAKLYYAMGQEDKAEKFILRVIDANGHLALDSPLKQVSSSLYTLKKTVTEGGTVDSQKLEKLSRLLVMQGDMSSMPMGSGTLGNAFAQFVSQCILNVEKEGVAASESQGA